MTEKDILKKIEESAQEVSTPETLKPEQMQQKLKKIRHSRKYPVSAAVLALALLGTISAVWWRQEEIQAKKEAAQGMAADSDSQDDFGYDMAAADTVTERESPDMSSEDAESPDISSEDAESSDMSAKDAESGSGKKQDAGELYTVASSYDEVYELLKEYGLREEVKYAMLESATDSVNFEGDYSETNLQTEGVDESDFVKTDGSYLYVTDDRALKIIDIRGEMPEKISEISFTDTESETLVREAYVDGGTLALIVEQYDISLESDDTEAYEQEENGEVEIDTEGFPFMPLEESSAADVAYSVEVKYTTKIIIYDISDPENPVLTGELSQEGDYYTSRKIGSIVYLFTRQTFGNQTIYDTAEEDGGKLIPLVNGVPVPADCIYLPNDVEYQVFSGLVVSSVDTVSPQTVLDTVMILNSGAEIYVGAESLYLYNSDSSGGSSITEITKFSLTEGKMNAAGAAVAPGYVRDTFAVNESEGNLRLLTTKWDGSTENILSIYREDMELAGRLEGIAQGEEIYAARYFGDIAYFVTYRNTDPLFAADVSDISNPVILGELEITGFSEYLHLWGAGKLLGVGYETDPETGRTEGVKLAMFDITNPAELSAVSSYVLPDADTTPAMWNYKCILADETQSLIGFVTSEYTDSGISNQYMLFSWEDGAFRELIAQKLTDSFGAEDYRGVFAGDFFYVVCPDGLLVYDRTNGYELLGAVVF